MIKVIRRSGSINRRVVPVGDWIGYGGRGPLVWTPLNLFKNREEGAWYDPSDLSTMFQDGAGMTPVTADGQPVGLILDKSKGLVLGPELVTNGTFTTDTDWTKGVGITISGGHLVFTAAVGTYATQVISGTADAYCEVTVVVSSVSSGEVGFQFDGAVGSEIRISSPGTYTYRRKQDPGFSSVFVISYGTTTAQVDSISIKKIAGNHASAPSDAARPLYKTTGASKWNDFDAVDDVLNTLFPVSLGASCTVARANVGAAPTILTAQTIGTTYANSTDNAGLIIVDRALTTQETTDLTAWLLAKGAT